MLYTNAILVIIIILVISLLIFINNNNSNYVFQTSILIIISTLSLFIDKLNIYEGGMINKEYDALLPPQTLPPQTLKQRERRTAFIWKFYIEDDESNNQIFRDGNLTFVFDKHNFKETIQIKDNDKVRDYCIECEKNNPEETEYGRKETEYHYLNCVSGNRVIYLLFQINKTPSKDIAIMTENIDLNIDTIREKAKKLDYHKIRYLKK